MVRKACSGWINILNLSGLAAVQQRLKQQQEVSSRLQQAVSSRQPTASKLQQAAASQPASQQFDVSESIV